MASPGNRHCVNCIERFRSLFVSHIKEYLLDGISMCLECSDDGGLDILSKTVGVTAQKLGKNPQCQCSYLTLLTHQVPMTVFYTVTKQVSAVAN